MRVGERGQVTIPKEIRERFGFGPDTEVEFVVRGQAVELVRSPGTRARAVRDLYGRMQFEAGTDELMRLLRE